MGHVPVQWPASGQPKNPLVDISSKENTFWPVVAAECTEMPTVYEFQEAVEKD